MIAMLCIRCKKNPAMVFINKVDPITHKSTNEGYCLHCAKDLGLAPVDDILKNMGITVEQYDEISDGMNQLMNSMSEYNPEEDEDSEDMDNSPLVMMSDFQHMLGNMLEEHGKKTVMRKGRAVRKLLPSPRKKRKSAFWTVLAQTLPKKQTNV